MMPPVIVDTNIVVAGLLTGNDESPVARILDGMLSALFPFVISEALLAEYHTVLMRPVLRKMHGLTNKEIDVLLTELAAPAIVLEPVVTGNAPDPGDQHLWELLAARDDIVLVTGDKRLLQDSEKSERVISAQQFITEYCRN